MGANLLLALDHNSPNLPRDDWFQILASVKSEMGDAGYDIAKNWSMGGDTYKEADFNSTWKSARATGGITSRTLFHFAKEAGWKQDGPDALVDEAARLKHRANIEADNKKAEAEKQQKNEAAVLTASHRLKVATDPNPEHPYLVKKGIQPIGIKQKGDNLLIL